MFFVSLDEGCVGYIEYSLLVRRQTDMAMAGFIIEVIFVFLLCWYSALVIHLQTVVLLNFLTVTVIVSNVSASTQS